MVRRQFLCASLCLVLLPLVVSPRLRAQAASVPLDALSGEYTEVADPATPMSLYAQDGKLVIESERLVPTELTPVSATEFAFPNSKETIRVQMGADGRASGIFFSTDPDSLYKRTGEPVHHVFHDYQRAEAMIPMRDGVKLHVVILKPADITGPLPFLMQRTPYGCDGTTREAFTMQRPDLARDGYIYVCGDIRGRFKSEGEFVMSCPLADHSDPKAIDESTDTYDTVAWLIKNVPGNNGRVGVVGTSYPGFLAMMAGIDPHPAVKAISPQAPMIDVWMGDDFFHNGAFRQSYGYDYVMGMESSKENSRRGLRQGQGRQAPRWLRLLSGAREFCRGCEAVGIEDAAHMEAVSRSPRL